MHPWVGGLRVLQACDQFERLWTQKWDVFCWVIGGFTWKFGIQTWWGSDREVVQMIFSSRFFETITGEDSDQGVAKMAMEAGWLEMFKTSIVHTESKFWHQGHGQRAQGIHQLNDLCCGLKGLRPQGRVFWQVLLSLTFVYRCQSPWSSCGRTTQPWRNTMPRWLQIAYGNIRKPMTLSYHAML